MNPLRWALLKPLFMWKGSKTLKYYKQMKSQQWEPLEDNLSYQRNQLLSIIRYSIENVPYYKKMGFKKNDFKEDTIFEDIRKIPFLTKNILRDNKANLYYKNRTIKFSYTNSSGGSSGVPVQFIQDNIMSDWGRATKILYDEWAQRKQGEPMVQLWGSQNDILGQSQGFLNKMALWTLNTTILNSFKMTKKDMLNYVGIINKNKPVMILSYADSIWEFSKFIQENKLEIHSPRSIMTSAGTLYPDYKIKLKKLFKCQVYNRYGSREAGDMACSCEKDNGLHINVYSHYIEILNNKNELCKPGELGRVYVTTLNNYSMPLIRYEIGDLAVPSEKSKCLCGRGLPLIERVEGREMCVFKTKNGQLISGVFFIHFIGVVHNNGSISKFQVIQKDYSTIEIKVILKNKNSFNKNKKDIENSIRKVMGKECNINWKVVTDIPNQKSGKYLYTISEI